MVVAGQGELGLEAGFVQLLLDLELEGGGRQKAGRRQPVQRRGGRHDDHIGGIFLAILVLAVLVQAPKRSQPLADQILVR
jgi:hypothetical protein